jgi:TRAP-type C4-dicarboxylate transport system substrate-binding protein
MFMGKNRIFITLSVVMALTCLTAVGYASEVIKLKFANYYHPTHKNSELAAQFCEEIKKRTNGRVEIAYFPGGILAAHPKMAQAVLTGVTDIGLANLAATRGRFPVSEVLDLPHGFPSAYVSTHVANDFYNKFKPKEWDNLHILYFHACGPNVVYTTKTPVKKLEDMSGLRLRAVSRVADVVKALGGTPVPVEMADIYESLNKGVVQGSYGPFEQIGGYKLGDLVKHATPALPVGSVFTFYVVMNKNKWNSLPVDIKKIFDEVSVEWIEKQATTWDGIDMDAIEYFKKSGGQLYTLSAEEAPKWKSAVAPVFAEYTNDMTGKGFKKPEVDSWTQFVQERIAYWLQKQKELKIKVPY